MPPFGCFSYLPLRSLRQQAFSTGNDWPCQWSMRHFYAKLPACRLRWLIATSATSKQRQWSIYCAIQIPDRSRYQMARFITSRFFTTNSGKNARWMSPVCRRQTQGNIFKAGAEQTASPLSVWGWYSWMRRQVGNRCGTLKMQPIFAFLKTIIHKEIRGLPLNWPLEIWTQSEGR